MSLIEINEQKNAIELYNKLYEYKKRADITEKEAFYILKSTNNPTIIKGLLGVIDGVCSDDKKSCFKDVVLGVVDCREQPKVIIDLCEKIAKCGGFEKEFNNVRYKEFEGEYYKSSPIFRRCYCKRYWQNSKENFDGYDEVILKYADFGDAVTIKTAPRVIKFDNRFKFRLKSSNLSGCDSIILDENVKKFSVYGTTNVCKKINFSDCLTVEFEASDVSNINYWSFSSGTHVCIDRCKLNKGTKIPSCQCLFLYDDMYEDENDIELCDIEKIYFRGKFPKGIDVSKCDVVGIRGCDLSKIDNVELKDGCSLYLNSVLFVDDKFDFMKCKYVEVADCNMKESKKLSFRKGSYVMLMNVVFPEIVDLSNCDAVHICNCNLSNVKELIFKNRRHYEAQRIYANKIFEGKISFTEDDELKSMKYSVSDNKMILDRKIMGR